MSHLLEHAEVLVAALTAFVSSVGAIIWRIEKLRRAFEDGVVRPVAREEAAAAVARHLSERHA